MATCARPMRYGQAVCHASALRRLLASHFLGRNDQQLFDKLPRHAHHQLIHACLGIPDQFQQGQQVLTFFPLRSCMAVSFS